MEEFVAHDAGMFGFQHHILRARDSSVAEGFVASFRLAEDRDLALRLMNEHYALKERSDD